MSKRLLCFGTILFLCLLISINYLMAGTSFRSTRNHRNVENLNRKSTSKIFSIGMPKAGTLSLHMYLKCEKILPSSHWICGERGRQTQYCGRCIDEAIKLNVSIDETCGFYAAYTQMDYEEKECYIPQMTHLDYLDKRYPKSKFILIMRDENEWLRSTHHWRRQMPLRLLRCFNMLHMVNVSATNAFDMKYWGRVYNDTNGDAILKQVVSSHHARVIKRFRHRPNDFLPIFLNDTMFEEKLSTFLNISGRGDKARKCWGRYHQQQEK